MSNPAAETSPPERTLTVDPLSRRPSFVALAGLFGVFYFLQGIGEPDDGLISQPVRSLLMRWDLDAGEIGRFSALIMLPWSIKPLYGLISDFLPLAGYRRKSYLVLTSSLSAAAMFGLSALPLEPGDTTLLLGLLMVPAVGIAFSDVAIDALMIENGQPRGWTGHLQSMQWTGMYAAAALAGVAGGYLSEHQIERYGFFFCGWTCLAALALSCAAPEQRRRLAADRVQVDWRLLASAWRIPVLRAAAVFLFLWNFNPFSASVLHYHLTKQVGFSQQFFGNLTTVTSLASMTGALSYGVLRRFFSFRVLLHASILLGIASTAAYWGLAGEFSARIVSAAVGFTTAVATLIQLDLAAQVCPIEIAGTVFAILMSLANLGTSLSAGVGGYAYTVLRKSLDGHSAFAWLVGIGSLTTAACWLVMPWLLRGLAAGDPQTAAECAAGE